MTTFTSSLPNELLEQLAQKSKKLGLPKNRIIERALSIYLEQLDKAEYIQSYRMAGQDEEIMNIAEEGMAEYVKQLPK